MDTWLKYIIMNLSEMDDIVWVQQLAAIIDKRTDTYNAGKFRGDIFYLTFMQKEEEKMTKSLGRSISMRFKELDQNMNSRVSMSQV